MTVEPLEPRTESAAANGKLHLFCLYADFPASLRARRAVSAITRIAGPDWRPSAEMWKLDSLASSRPIRDMISSDAANADVMIVGVSSLEYRALELVQWLDSLAAQEPARSTPGLLVGLLGDDENKSQELDWTVRQLIGCAQRSNRNFIWRWMEADALDDSGWLAGSVGELLSRKSAANDEPVFC